MEEKKDINIDLILKSLKRAFPWIDDIKTREKRVHYASNELSGQNAIVTVIELYFNYDNPEYDKMLSGSLSKVKFKNQFYDFLDKYFNIDLRHYGSPIDLDFYEVGPRII